MSYLKDRIIHHLVYIHPSKHRDSLFDKYYMGCGRKFLLKNKGLLNCSHVEMVTCKQCLKKHTLKNKRKNYDN